MKLTQHEKDSILWKKLKGHLNDLLEKDRRELEKMSKTQDETFFIRGRIKRTRDLISLESASEETEN